MKRLLTLLIVLLATVALVWLGWYLFIRDKNVPLGEAISNALPFGSGDNLDAPNILKDNSPATTTGASSFDEFGSPKADLFRLSDSPVAGSVVFKRNAQEIVRYVDRATGHIYEVVMPSANSTQLDKTRITNNTLPKIYEAHFKSDGSAVLVRSLKDDSDMIENLSLSITAPSAKATSTEFYTLTSTAIRGDTGSAIAVGSNLVYVLKDNNTITTSAFNGSGVKALFTSPFTDWQLHTYGNNILVETSPSSNVPGYAYTLNSSGGSLTKLLGPLNGLVATGNTAGTRIVYSYIDNEGSKTFAKNLQNNTTSGSLPTTLAEKCVWSIKNVNNIFCAVPIDGVGFGEPDLWYRGVTHFSDRIWLIETGDEIIVQVVSEPKQGLGVDVDVANPSLSPDEDYLIFTNKTDLTLWALRLEKF